MSFAARRPKPRRIAAAEDSDSDSAASPVVRKPATAAPRSQKPKRPASRLSFGDAVPTDSDAAAEPAFVPKKSALSRKAIERNAALKLLPEPAPAPAQDRVSYSKEALDELKSTQLVASEAVAGLEELEGATIVDLPDVEMAGAMTVDTAPAGTTGIIDEGLVRVLKQRRQTAAAALRAGADDYISLSADALSLRPKKRESRLARPDDFADDEEIATFVDDAERVLLTSSKRAQREQERRRKAAIAATIDEAEELVDSDASRDELVDEWERDQIRKGAFASSEGAARGLEAELEALAKNPPTACALPDAGDVLARLEAAVAEMRLRMHRSESMVEALVREKDEIRAREEMVQTRLREAGEQYERLKIETGIGSAGPEGVVDRGLESFGNTPVRVADEMRD